MANKRKSDPFKTFKEFFGNQKWITSVEKQFEQQYKNVTGSFDKNFKKAISRFNLISSKDIGKIEKRLADIEKRVNMLAKGKKSNTKKSTTKKPTKAKVSSPGRAKKTQKS